ncbi:MAG: PH domain-containing protein [Pirellulales bacterium]|nr:hypothetical protein [Planctomycetales bacterium]
MATKQAIAGVAPPADSEVTMMIVYPSNAAHPLGRWLGQLFSTKLGVPPLTLGNLLALLTIPVSLALFFGLLWPWAYRRYVLTNRRLIVKRGWRGTDDRWVKLDGFDDIAIEVLPGQEWYHAGEMIFKKGAVETFRISGVPRPEPFRQTCLKAHRAYVSVEEVTRRQAKLVTV